MLTSLADSLDEIRADQLGPVELSLTEFLTTCVAGENGESRPGGAAGARAAHLHRICQTIETRLGDPDLSPAKVAEEHGVSQRYLQKLFTLAGKTFSGYVRARRLERCHADLVSPLYAQLSISEICFRWGFNGSSHFSRAFRERYGVSPREYRRTETRGRTEGVAAPLE
jgi:AraC-like DNA-binding protein